MRFMSLSFDDRIARFVLYSGVGSIATSSCSIPSDEISIYPSGVFDALLYTTYIFDTSIGHWTLLSYFTVQLGSRLELLPCTTESKANCNRSTAHSALIDHPFATHRVSPKNNGIQASGGHQFMETLDIVDSHPSISSETAIGCMLWIGLGSCCRNAVMTLCECCVYGATSAECATESVRVGSTTIA